MGQSSFLTASLPVTYGELGILPFGLEDAVRSGTLLAELEGRGEPIGVEDVLIAATALEHGLTVATRNVRHFSRIQELPVES